MPPEPTSLIVTVTGLVQGVSYRAWARRWAEGRARLAGWSGTSRRQRLGSGRGAAGQGGGSMIDAMRRGARPAAGSTGLTALPGASPEATGFDITGLTPLFAAPPLSP